MDYKLCNKIIKMFSGMSMKNNDGKLKYSINGSRELFQRMDLENIDFTTPIPGLTPCMQIEKKQQLLEKICHVATIITRERICEDENKMDKLDEKNESGNFKNMSKISKRLDFSSPTKNDYNSENIDDTKAPLCKKRKSDKEKMIFFYENSTIKKLLADIDISNELIINNEDKCINRDKLPNTISCISTPEKERRKRIIDMSNEIESYLEYDSSNYRVNEHSIFDGVLSTYIADDNSRILSSVINNSKSVVDYQDKNLEDVFPYNELFLLWHKANEFYLKESQFQPHITDNTSRNGNDSSTIESSFKMDSSFTDYAKNIKSKLNVTSHGCTPLNLKSKFVSDENRYKLRTTALKYNNDRGVENMKSRIKGMTYSPCKTEKKENDKEEEYRHITKQAYRVLDAPNLLDDYYVNMLDWSQKNLLLVGLGPCIFLWDPATCEINELANLIRDDNDISSVKWSDTGNMFAIGTVEGYTQIWDTETGKHVYNIGKHHSRIGTVAWDNWTVITGSRDCSIQINDLRLAMSGESRDLWDSVSSNSDNFIGFRRVEIVPSFLKKYTVIKNNEKFIRLPYGYLQKYDNIKHPLPDYTHYAQDKSIVRCLSAHTQEVCGLKISPCKNYLASGGNDNLLMIWSLNKCKNPVLEFKNNFVDQYQEKINMKRKVDVKNMDRNSPLKPILKKYTTCGDTQLGVGYNKQDCNQDSGYSLRDYEKEKYDNNLCNCDYSPCYKRHDEKSAEFKKLEKNIKENNTADRIFNKHSAAVKAIAWSPHRHGLIASGGGSADRCIKFNCTLTGRELDSVDTGSQVCCLEWSPYCEELISAHGYVKNKIILWDYPSMNEIVSFHGHKKRVLYMAISPDGENIVTGAGDETIRFWRAFSSPKIDQGFKHKYDYEDKIR